MCPNVAKPRKTCAGLSPNLKAFDPEGIGGSPDLTEVN
jgi:hypothetical protein